MKVFFDIRSNFRERQWDTVRHVPPGVEALLPPGVAPLGSLATYAASKSFKGKLKQWAARHLPLVNMTQLPDLQDQADVIYTWAKIPRNARKPFIIEFDNPYAVTYYNRWAFRLYRPLLRTWFKKARALTFMSEASRALFLQEMGGEAGLPPCHVVYPYMEVHSQNTQRASGQLQFLFVGLDFRLKGGPELLEAFRRADLGDAVLNVVSVVADDVRARYKDDPNIVFHGALSRERLFNDLYPRMDVFVLPTFYESFGVVVLEALSFGMGVIATDVFAMPELVTDGVNGRILPHPVLHKERVGDREIVNVTAMHFNDFIRRYLRPGSFYEGFCEDIRKAFVDAAAQHREWGAESVKLYGQRFGIEAWQRHLREALAGSGPGGTL
jgi:glycosyltransferase involved in cell wall biosynthesis